MLREKYGDFPEDGGALAVPLNSSEEAFEWILKAADTLGYGDKVTLGLDVAASELWENEHGIYRLGGGKEYSTEELNMYYQELCKKYPLTLIEDGFDLSGVPSR